MLKKTLYIILSFMLLGVLGACQGFNRESKFVESFNLVPNPKEINGEKNDKGEYKAYKYNATIKTEENEFKNAMNSFSEYGKKLFDVEFKENNKADIILNKDNGLDGEAYRIVADKKSIKVYASTEKGINNGLATLLQIMEKAEDGIYIPAVEINDAPDSTYRGMMVDLARDWHEFEYLLNYVDMCYFYKISVLHLHFTDDQSYTLPSDAYPDLPTENRHYTKEQLNTLVEYAHERGIELMPEIDIPGHCTQFQQKYSKIFGFGGIIHQHEDAFEALETIFDELCEIFKYSKYIHIGGDEAAIANWTQCKRCRDYAKTQGIDSDMSDKRLLSEQMLAHFVSRIGNVVFKNEKTPIVWEGFAKEVNDMVSKDIIVMSWENYYQITPDLLEGGFTIINCSWNPMYVVTPVAKWLVEEVFEWDIFSWKPVHPQSPYIKTGGIKIEPHDKVIGGQLLAWGDHIEKQFENVEDGVKEEMRLLLERLPALSENTWNKEKTRTFEEFIVDAESLNERLTPILKIGE